MVKIFLRSQAFLTGRDVHEYDGESNDCDAFLGARAYQNALLAEAADSTLQSGFEKFTKKLGFDISEKNGDNKSITSVLPVALVKP